MGTRYLLAFVIGAVLGIGVPAAAQSVVRLYGTQSDGTITQVLITAAGRLVVVGQ